MSNKELVKTLEESGASLIFLLPEDIIVEDSVLRARPMYDPEQETKEVEELAESMVRDSQIEPVVVRILLLANVPEGESNVVYYLVAGRRRVDAAFVINSRKSKGEEPFRLAAIVNPTVTAENAFQVALSENLKRKNLSAVQFAMVCKSVREEHGWAGGKNTKKVAEFLQVSPATVTQAEKLLTLPEDMQKQVHSGELTAKAAFDLVDVKPEHRGKVLADAKDRQATEEKTNVVGPNASAKGTGKKKAVQSKHVRSAARDTEDALEKPKSRSRKDILTFFEMSDGPAYGFPDGAVRTFITYFLKWAMGEGTDRTLTSKFDAMVEKADQGSAASVKPEPEEKKAATKKAPKPKAEKKPKPVAKKKAAKKK